MIKFYFQTILFFMIIIFCFIYILKDKIEENGWLDNIEKRKEDPYFLLFVMSAVPILRVIFVIAIMLMGAYTKEQLEEKLEEFKNE